MVKLSVRTRLEESQEYGRYSLDQTGFHVDLTVNKLHKELHHAQHHVPILLLQEGVQGVQDLQPEVLIHIRNVEEVQNKTELLLPVVNNLTEQIARHLPVDPDPALLFQDDVECLEGEGDHGRVRVPEYLIKSVDEPRLLTGGRRVSPDLAHPGDSGDPDSTVGVLKAGLYGRLGVREEDGEAGDGRDGGAPHGGVRVGHVSAENVDHQQSDIWVVGRGLDDQVTD